MKSLGNEITLKLARFLLFQLQKATFQMIKQFAIRRYYTGIVMNYDAIKIADVAPSNHLNEKLYISTCLSIFVLWP